MKDGRQCTAKAKSTGKRCGRAAAKGATVCVKHGAAAPQVQKAAKERIERAKAEGAVAMLGLPREIDPHSALLEEVHRAAGHVAWLAHEVTQLEREKVVYGVTKAVQLPDGKRQTTAEAALNVWVRLYQDERDRLVRVCKAAVDAGVAERQVEIAEAQARQLADVIGAVLTDLGHDLNDQRTREVVRLRLIKGGEAA